MNLNPKEYAVDHLTLEVYAKRFARKKEHLRIMLKTAIAVIESFLEGTPMPTVYDLNEALGVEYVPPKRPKRKPRKKTQSASSENESAARQPKARKRAAGFSRPRRSRSVQTARAAL